MIGIFAKSYKKQDIFLYKPFIQNAKNSKFGIFNKLVPYKNTAFKYQKHP